MKRTQSNLLAACAALAALTACSDQNLTDNLTTEPAGTGITFRVDDFYPQETSAGKSTRTTVTPGTTYSVVWAAGDRIGIFPEDGNQVSFRITDSQVGQASAQFDGGNWAIKDGIEYNAYYPFNESFDSRSENKNAIPVTYQGQSQTGKTCQVGVYDYTYSDWKVAQDGTAQFNFHHIGAIVELSLTVPVTSAYTSLSISAGQACMPLMGSYDLTQAAPAFACSGSLASAINLELKSFDGTAGEESTFYLMLPPMDLTGQTLTATLSTGNTACTYSLTPFKSEAGHIVRLTGTPQSSTIPGTPQDWASCQPSDNGQVSNITNNSAHIEAQCSADLENVTHVGVLYSSTQTTPTKSNATSMTVPLESLSEDGAYSLDLTGLETGTTYYYRTYYVKGGANFNGKVQSFTTKTQAEYYNIQLETGTTDSITCYSAKVTNRIIMGTGPSYCQMEYGVSYGTEPDPTAKIAASTKDAAGNYTVILQYLDRDTKYYYRPYVTIDGETTYGNQSEFTTTSDYVVETLALTNQTCYSAKVKSRILVTGQATGQISEYGVSCGKTEPPTAKTAAKKMGTDNIYHTSLLGLEGATTYHYRPYIVMNGKTYYGKESTLTTPADDIVETGTIDTLNMTVKSSVNLGDGSFSQICFGVCYSQVNAMPTVDDATRTTTDLDDEGCYTITISKISGTLYYRSYILIDGVAHYGAVNSVTIPVGNNGHDYVDLGLSVLWATCNVGAATPEGYGDYFAWGATEPYYDEGYAQSDSPLWKSGKTGGYYWSSYKYCLGGYNTLIKYCTQSSYGYGGFTDGKTVLDAQDDAASVNWGGTWRMPTVTEFQELYSNCTWTWYGSGNSEFGGIAGYKLTSNKSGYTDRSIFLPAAGSRWDTDLNFLGYDGFYWSSSVNTDDPYSAYYLYFNSSGNNWSNWGNRYIGFSVRPVCQ